MSGKNDETNHKNMTVLARYCGINIINLAHVVNHLPVIRALSKRIEGYSEFRFSRDSILLN